MNHEYVLRDNKELKIIDNLHVLCKSVGIFSHGY